MKGAKFVVLSLRDILKTLALILVGIAIIVVLFFLFFPNKTANENEESNQYVPGTYSSNLDLKGDPLEIFVVIDENGILEINTSTLSETQQTYYPLITVAFENLKPQILEHQTTNIELSSDNYYTEQALLKVIDEALTKSLN